MLTPTALPTYPSTIAPSDTDAAPRVTDRVVVWSMDLASESAADAAVQALGIHRDPASIATVFTVYEPDGTSVTLDVEDPEAPVVVGRTEHTSAIQVGRPYRLTRDLIAEEDRDVVALAGELVTPTALHTTPRSGQPRWSGVVAHGATTARTVIIPGREWLADVAFY